MGSLHILHSHGSYDECSKEIKKIYRKLKNTENIRRIINIVSPIIGAIAGAIAIFLLNQNLNSNVFSSPKLLIAFLFIADHDDAFFFSLFRTDLPVDPLDAPLAILPHQFRLDTSFPFVYTIPKLDALLL